MRGGSFGAFPFFYFMEKEIWKPIKGYEGFYKISNLGRVKSLDRWYYSNKGRHVHVKEKIMNLCDDSKGYPFVVLSKHNKMKIMPIHRLIAEAFIPNPLNKPCIDHIDTNPHNFSISNLRWCSYKENNNNPITIKKLKAILGSNDVQRRRIETTKIRKGKTSPKYVYMYDLNGKFIRMFSTTLEAANFINTNSGNIHYALYKQKTTHSQRL